MKFKTSQPLDRKLGFNCIGFLNDIEEEPDEELTYSTISDQSLEHRVKYRLSRRKACNRSELCPGKSELSQPDIPSPTFCYDSSC